MRVRIAQPHVRFGDPHVTTDDPSRLSIQACLFETLVRRLPGGRFRTELADRYSVSADARTWRFTIRDARFHDGRPVTAEDAAFSFRRVRDGDLPGELGTTGVIQSYLAGSDISVAGKEVTLVVAHPTADLLDMLVDLPIVPVGYSGEEVGSGPYRLESRSDTSVRLKLASDLDLPAEIEFVAVPDRAERASVGADIAADVAPEDGATRAHTTVCTSFICNLDQGACSQLALRQAINHAVNVEAILRDVLGGAGEPLRGPLTRRHLGFDASVEGFAYDPDAARRLLDSSGLAGTELVLDVPTLWPDEAVATGTRVVEYLADVGLNAKLAVHENRPAYAEMVRAKEMHDAACFDSSPSSTFRVLWEKFHSGHRGPWWQGYTNRNLDLLVDQARATADIFARSDLYRKAFRVLSQDAPWLFLYSPARSFAVGERLEGWTPPVDGYAIFH